MKIYDTFCFFNEIELLKMRFEVLYDHVDYFVITEANQTFTMKHSPKDMIFWSRRRDFEKYLDKVIYVPVIDEFKEGNPWNNEYHQRNSIARGLVRYPRGETWPSYLVLKCEVNGLAKDLPFGANDDDIVIMSDVDEIPDPSLFPVMKGIIEAGKEVTFEQRMFRYFLNCQCTHELWKGSRAISYARLRDDYNSSLESLRHVDESFIQGGWHYTGMGGVERFIKKMQSFSHADICDVPQYTDVDNMKKLFKERVLDNGRDVHHFNNATYQILMNADDFLPPQCSPEDYQGLIYDETKEF